MIGQIRGQNLENVVLRNTRVEEEEDVTLCGAERSTTSILPLYYPVSDLSVDTGAAG